MLDQSIDTSDATGRLLFNMFSAISQFEAEIRAERQWMAFKKPNNVAFASARRKN
jgi:DNA invertase Pin-like site-specific DNA recombinase